MVPAIHLRDLSFAWPGQTAACLTLSALDVDQGEQVFIQGDSGAGKSTLLNLIGGVLLPREGRIQILGQALDALSAPARDRFRVDHIGFIFQQFNLLPYLSALDNVLLPCRFSATRARRAGPRPVEAAHRLLEALEVDAGDAARPASTLSVGQQQRVAAARALIGRPALVLADEPTSALDPRRQDAFLALLGKEVAAHGSSLVLVSHDPRLASRFDRCITL